MTQQDPCSKCGMTIREQMKGCDKNYCYRQFLGTKTSIIGPGPVVIPPPGEGKAIKIIAIVDNEVHYEIIDTIK